MLDDEVSGFSNIGSLSELLESYKNNLTSYKEISMIAIQDFKFALTSYFGYEIGKDKLCQLFALEEVIDYLESQRKLWINFVWKKEALTEIINALKEYLKILEDE